MAIGGNFNNENGTSKNSLYEYSYYPRLKVKNNESKVILSFTFNNGLLKAEISEIKDGFNYSTLESIFITPTKALLLSKQIKSFLEYIKSTDKVDPNKAFGITSGMGEKVSYLGIHQAEDGHILITIGKIDGSGNITNKATCPLNKEYNYAIEWNNIDNMDLVKAYYDDIELIQISQLVEDFGRYMNGAAAYSLLDLQKYDYARLLNKMDPIYDKLGIEKRTNNSYKSNNFLSNSDKVSSNSTSFDFIESSF